MRRPDRRGQVGDLGATVEWGAELVCSAQGHGAMRISLPSITQEIKVPPDYISPRERTHTHTHHNAQKGQLSMLL